MKKINLLTMMSLAFTAFAASSCSDSRYTIGVLYPLEHAALKTCAEGFVAGLEKEGLVKDKDFKIVEKNAEGNDADLVSFAKDLVASSDMTFGLGTDASIALKSASVDKGSIKPVVFSAVTDPVKAELVKSLENGEGFVCGTTDAQPVDAQIALIKEIIPSADKIGILYTQSEINSKLQADQAKEAATKNGMTSEIMTITNSNEIPATTLALASVEGIDAIYIPTDNTIAGNMGKVKEQANSKHVLVVTGEENMLKAGGHVSLSLDYKELGSRAGKMAAEIIKGNKKAYEFPVTGMSKEECKYVYSSVNLADSGITLPAEFVAKATDVSK